MGNLRLLSSLGPPPHPLFPHFSCFPDCSAARSPAIRIGGTRHAVRRVSMQAARTHTITLLPGDGIGPEIMDACVKVLHAAGKREDVEFTTKTALIGGAAIDATGSPLPEETMTICKSTEAVLLAAIGGYKWDNLPQTQKPEKGLLGLRKGLEAFANLRPAKVLPQLADSSTLKKDVIDGVDIMIIRELTGGIYFGEPRGIETRNGERVGFNTEIYSESEIKRIARVGFETARKRRGKLCSVEKANVLEASQLWKDVVIELGKSEYPDVELSHMYIDNACMQMIRNPKQFDTIVTGNIFGDILSDEASMLTGSLGMLPSASVGDGSLPGIYEPVHGSAPDIAGQDIANPMAQVLSAAMMCQYSLNEPAVAKRMEDAVEKALDAGYRTGDLMSPGMTKVKCSQLGDLLVKMINDA